MSPLLATIIGIALYAVVLLPLVGAVLWGRAPRLLVVYGSFLAVVAVFNTGIFQRGSLAPTDTIVRAAGPAEEAQCQQILELMRESGLTVDRSDPSAPKLTGRGANQLPPELRDVLLQCAEQAETASRVGGQNPAGD